MTVRVVFITGHQMGKDKLTGQYTAAGASARLRVILPVFELTQYGIETVVHSIRSGHLNALTEILETYRPAVVVVSKLFDDIALPALARSRELGATVIVDLCDNYVAEGDYYELTTALIKICDRLTVNTTQMQQKLITSGVKKPITVIDDLVEGESFQPRDLYDGTSLNLLAFGSKFVCKELDTQMDQLYELGRVIRFSLEVVTSLDEETYRWIALAQKRYLSDHFKVSLTMWHENILRQMFSRADLVLIPSSFSEFNETKSPNRCMQSIWAGLPVVAFPLPSYTAFQDFCVLDESMASGIQIARQVRNWEERIKRGQHFIDSHYTPQVIGKRWAAEIMIAAKKQPLI
jgi:hypothetical protein